MQRHIFLFFHIHVVNLKRPHCSSLKSKAETGEQMRHRF